MTTRALILAAAASLALAACGTRPSVIGEDPPPPSPAEASDELSYVALGDSLSTTYGGANKAWPSIYGKAAGKALGEELVVESEAIPGITSGDLLSMLHDSTSLRDQIAAAEIVTIYIGGNDFRNANEAALVGGCAAEGDLSCHRDALEGLKERLEAIVEELLSLRSPSDTIIRMLDNFDRFPDNEVIRAEGYPKEYSETIRPILQEWNEFTCDLAESKDIPCVSLYEAFNGPRGEESPFEAGLLGSDGDHLSDRGHRAVAAELAKLGFAPLA
jgi:lysophospholipase L1-like esterase